MFIFKGSIHFYEFDVLEYRISFSARIRRVDIDYNHTQCRWHETYRG